VTLNPVDMTDADFELLDLEAAAEAAANGVCSICEDALNPLEPRWAKTTWPRTRTGDGSYRETTAEEMVAQVGPVHPQLPYHVWCLEGEND
jgi:hypothetical protein